MTSSFRTSGSGTLVKRRAPLFLYLPTTNAFMVSSPIKDIVAASGAEEGQGFRHKIGMVLENPAMPGVCVDNQFCARDTARHIDAVCGRHHDVAIAIRDQDRDPNAPEILRRLSAPSSDRFDLPQESARCRALVPACLALFQAFQEGFRRLTAIGRGREKQVKFRVS